MTTEVSIIKCPTYDLDMIAEGIDKSIKLLGGWQNVASRSDTVLIKPNLIRAMPVETGVNTHPLMIRALIQLLENKVGCRIMVGDSSGERFRNIEDVWQISGLQEAVRGTSARLIKFDKAKQVQILNGKIFKSLPIATPVLDADVLISVPKLKTHDVTLITAGAKNLLGVVPGLFKFRFHKDAPHLKDFGEAIADILSVVKPKLTIVDGIISMEGDGPISGKLRKMGLLLASKDPIALDAVISTIIGLRPLDVPTTLASKRRGLGVSDLACINMVGEKPEELLIKDFILPANTVISRIPQPLVKLIGRGIMVKPIVDRSKCNGCLICQDSCPVNAISMYGKERIPVFNYRLCIRCLCCYEICPFNAVIPQKNLLAKLYFSNLKQKFFSFMNSFYKEGRP